MRVSPNLFDNALPSHGSPPASSILSMDLFNSIDFDRLSSLVPCSDASPTSNRIPSFNRPRPSARKNAFHSTHLDAASNSLAARPTNASHPVRLPPVRARDDRQILERLAHQVNQFNGQERTPLSREHHPMDALESILYANAHPHDSRTGVPETRVSRRRRRLLWQSLIMHRCSIELISCFSRTTPFHVPISDGLGRYSDRVVNAKRESVECPSRL